MDFILAKFGNREHLQSLVNGNLYLKAIDEYRQITNNYRGDPWEGKIPVDPNSIEIYNKYGKNIFEYCPRPCSVMQETEGDGKVPIFCASIINKKVLNEVEEGFFVLNERFCSEMQKFVSHLKDEDRAVLLFHSSELLENLLISDEYCNKKLAFMSGGIIYRHLNNYSYEGEKTNPYFQTGSFYDRYFVKGMGEDDGYYWQNEWRLIVDGQDSPVELDPDHNSITIKIPSLTNTLLLTFSDFLKLNITFQK